MIYLDNSATTKPSEAVKNAVLHMLEDDFGNPSSRYTLGLTAEKILIESRKSIADSLHVQPKNIIFTSGGTESDNLALLGSANIKVGKHIVTTSIEHAAVLNTMKALEKEGFSVTYVKPSSDGVCSRDDILSAVTKDTCLVSVMHINNETGAIMPIENLSSAIKRISPRAIFHVDAVQSYGKIDLQPMKWGVDLMSISSHKIHGPKGIGALYKKDGVNLKATMFGGGQEGNLRSGTENMIGIAGFSVAAKEIDLSAWDRLKELKEDFANKILALPDTELNGSFDGSPYVLNVSFLGIRSEILLNALSDKGVYVSAGSACSKGAKNASYVIREMGSKYADNAIRFSFSKHTTKEELDEAYNILKKNLEFLR